MLPLQLDQTPRHERSREDDVDPSGRCVQIRLGQRKTVSGVNRGFERAIQGRCTSCHVRKKILHAWSYLCLSSAKTKLAGLNTLDRSDLILISNWKFKFTAFCLPTVPYLSVGFFT